jgi:hypothetical protein
MADENKKRVHPLKKYRTENRWKHKDIAYMLDCSVAYPGQVERGCRVGPALAEKLAKMCKCSKDVFLYPGRYKEKYGI